MVDIYVLALDQGTTSSRAILFDHDGKPAAVSQREFQQIYPKPGWVEHDPEDIWGTQLTVARDVLNKAGVAATSVAVIGITNQRETTVVWNRATGRPVYNAIVWQDRRTSAMCDALKARGLEETVRARTGLVVDAYFSGTKLAWVLDNVAGARAQAERGELAFGTVDTFLMWRLSGGAIHRTDYSNASRTMLFNIHKMDWDDDILRALNIPHGLLPEVCPSSYGFGETVQDQFGAVIPIGGVAGDQQAATFGQVCFEPGMVKNTYGTGSFMLMNTGEQPKDSANGLLTTVAWGFDNKVTYALEGSIFVTGAAVQWLRDELGLIRDAAETEELAGSVPDSGGVYLVPAFVGLGAPYWDQYARGTIVGLTRGSGRAQIVRATLESVCYQSRDVLEVMRADSGLPVKELRVDGGMVANNVFLQLQADIAGARVVRPAVTETTALGAAYLAGLQAGYWSSQQEVADKWAEDCVFEPAIDDAARAQGYRGWKRAVERSRGWARDE